MCVEAWNANSKLHSARQAHVGAHHERFQDARTTAAEALRGAGHAPPRTGRALVVVVRLTHHFARVKRVRKASATVDCTGWNAMDRCASTPHQARRRECSAPSASRSVPIAIGITQCRSPLPPCSRVQASAQPACRDQLLPALPERRVPGLKAPLPH